MIAPANATLLERLQLFAVARPETFAAFDARPFGIAAPRVFDPLRRTSAPFLSLLKRLDEVTFGPEGMPMPRWVFLDGAELTGGIVGFGAPAAELSDAARDLLGVADAYAGVVPLAMFIAIPTFEPGVWFGHNLASVAGRLPGDNLRGLGSLTKAVALAMFRAHTQLGATQWPSRALYVHTRLGPLELITASTPAHGDDDTLTYRAAITEAALRNLARDPSASVDVPAPTEWVHCRDLDRIRALQRDIEAGARWVIAGRPRPADDGHSVPIAPG